MIMKLLKTFILSLTLLFSGNIYAENTKVFDNYIVKYNVLSSQQLSEQLIRAFRLKRENSIGYVQVELISKNRSNTPVRITGKSNNMARQSTLNFKEQKFRGNSMYFAEFKFENKDICYFEINLQPQGKAAPYRLKFSKSLNLK